MLAIDLQSSGATPKHGHIIELAWAKTHARHDRADVDSHLVALPEDARLPRAVSRITGIARKHLQDAASPEAAWRALLSAAAEQQGAATATVPTIIHYARFETTFLRDLHQRFTADRPFPFDIVCTHKIAKRLHPDLPRRGLRALAGYFGFPVELLRRSEGHVAATVFSWHHLAAELADLGVDSWPELVQWLAARPAAKARTKRRFPMPRDKRLALPDKPGVYRFLRTSGDVLYVGKATSLKKRVNSYFTKRVGRDERLLEMLSQARDLDTSETATSLEAALLETEEIKRLSPPYNVHLRNEIRQVWFTSPDFVHAETSPSVQCPIGPWPSRFWLSAMAALCRILDGEARDEATIARAVGARGYAAPSQPCFEQGLRLFTQRYHIEQIPGARARQRLGAASKVISKRARAGTLDEGSKRNENDPEWDPERIARHLERTVWHTGQLARRGRWLCLLCDATIAWHEPKSPLCRLLRLSGGHIIERGYVPSERPLPPPTDRRTHRQRQACFDIPSYDRLRILSTELRRVMSVSEARVRINHRPALSGRRLRAALDCA